MRIPVAFAAGLLAMAGVAAAASDGLPDATTVSIDAVPDLRAHLDTNYAGLFPFETPNSYSAATMLGAFPDRRGIAVAAVEVRAPPPLADTELSPGPTGGRSGGVGLKPVPPKRVAPARPGCPGGAIWSGGRDPDSRGGVAAYAYCGSSVYALALACRDDARPLQVMLAMPVAAIAGEGPTTARIVVDGRSYEMNGSARFSEMTGGYQTVFRIGRRGDVVGALQRGRTATVLVGEIEFGFHLSGSAKAIETMFSRCRP